MSEEIQRQLVRVLELAEDNRRETAALNTTVQVMQVDVGYLKGEVQKNVADQEEKIRAKNGRWFSMFLVSFSLGLGVVAASIKSFFAGGGNVGQ